MQNGQTFLWGIFFMLVIEKFFSALGVREVYFGWILLEN